MKSFFRMLKHWPDTIPIGFVWVAAYGARAMKWLPSCNASHVYLDLYNITHD